MNFFLEGFLSFTSAWNLFQVAVKKKTKILTKVAAAKKALKKNLTVNSKVVFDEDGEVLKTEHFQFLICVSLQLLRSSVSERVRPTGFVCTGQKEQTAYFSAVYLD